MHPIRGIIIHWVENPMLSAESTRNFFELRKDGFLDFGSAHDIVGLAGEVIHCIPYLEMAYHVGAYTYMPKALTLFSSYPNNCTIGIELCHPDWSGKPTAETAEAAAVLCAGLCINYQLDPLRHIQTHSWVTGKITEHGPCHKYYVNNPDAFDNFRLTVRGHIGDII